MQSACRTKGESRNISRRAFLAVGGALAGLPFLKTSRTSAAVKRPNLLLVFPDQLRYDWTGLNPSVPVRTPNLVRLAEEGARFDMAFCPAPVCAASRACLATGMQYGRAGVRGNEDNLPDDAMTIYALLRGMGYRVGSTGKLDLRKAAHDWGPDGMHRVNGTEYFRRWGFTDGLDSEGKGDTLRGVRKRDGSGEPYGDSPYTKMLDDRRDGSFKIYLDWWEAMRRCETPVNNYSFTTPVKLADDAYNDNWVGQNALHLIENFPKDGPWFLQVNFPGPHAPMDITESMAGLYKETSFGQPFENNQLDAATHVTVRRNYSAMVENIDRWLGKYLDALDRRGELENTIVAFSSDHGEMLGDHNRWGKTVPYQPSSVVPLVMRGPGIKRGARRRGPTATLDLTATFLDYAGVDVKKQLDSRTLRPLLEGNESATRPYVTSGLHEWRMVCDGRYKLIRGFDAAKPDRRSEGGEKYEGPVGGKLSETYLLFDLENDPNEGVDISKDQQAIVDALTKLLPDS